MSMKRRYDCSKCPSYCCSYPTIELKAGDIKRLAVHFGISKKDARKRFAKSGKADGKKKKPDRMLRHQNDPTFGTICIFFDTKARRCTIYDARPEICRDYPGRKKCGYYEFLQFERDAQEDSDYIALTGN